jgi:uncharacterized protein
LCLGVLLLGLGYIGYVVPGMPGTIFFIIALWSFKRSSPRMEAWLLARPVIGPALRDWDEDRSMTMRSKILAVGCIWVSIVLSSAALWSRPSAIWLIPLIVAVALSVTVYLLTRKTKIR